MSNFGPGTKTATEELTIDNDGTAHPRSNGQHGHVGDVAPGAETEFGPPCGVGVIFYDDRQRNTAFEFFTKGLIAPRNVGRVIDHGLVGINESSGGDPGSDNSAPPRQLLDQVNHRVNHGLRV